MSGLSVLVSRAISCDTIVKWWQDKKLSTVEDYNLALDNFRVIFSCNSANIEGSSISYHTTRDIFEDADIKGFTGKATDIIEMQNQKFAFNFLISALANKEQITIPFILKLHKIMMNGCYTQQRWNNGERPGTFKVNDYCVGLTSEGSLPEEVVDDLADLLDEVNGNDHNDILTNASYFHLQFETIHPFSDGNGRVGRTLMNYYLMLNDYPPCVLYHEDRETYYLALEVWDRTNKLDGFKVFLKEQMVKTWKDMVKKQIK